MHRNHAPPGDHLPPYVEAQRVLGQRAPRAAAFADQILRTVGPYLPAPPEQLRVLDVGCGYGHTAVELARRCLRVVGIEPCPSLFGHAQRLGEAEGLPNVAFRRQPIAELCERACFDLVVLDNVLEHLPDQALALRQVSRVLRGGGVAYILVPNKLWPLEVHYRLPFLSYLPLRLANLYLRWTGRGTDYTDASYAPTYWGLNRLLRQCPEMTFRYVLPADVSLATHGRSWHYRAGVAALRRCPWLWAISKVFLVVGVKR